MLPGIILELARPTLCVVRAARGISQRPWAVGNLNARGTCSAQWGSCLWLDLSHEPLPDARVVPWEWSFFNTADKHVAGCPLPSWGTQQSPAYPGTAGSVGTHNSTSGRAARCSETETWCTFCLPTSLVKKQRKILISGRINKASSSPLLDAHPAQWDFICEYEALTLVHLSWTNSAFLSNLGKAENNLTYFILMFPRAPSSHAPLFPPSSWHCVVLMGLRVSIWGWCYCPVSLPTATASSAQA